MDELKTITLSGKKYMMVAERLKYFRSNFSTGSIQTSYEIAHGAIVVKAEIFLDGKLMATGHGLKSMKQEFNMEKVETRAIGRALAILGIGLDAGISSYEEVKEYFESTGVEHAG